MPEPEVLTADHWFDLASLSKVIATTTMVLTLAEQGRLDLERALEKLNPAQRLCVVLSYGEGLSHGEIAETTGWPLGTVKSHLARGGARG